MRYDVIAIGGGPAGYTAAMELAKRGKKVALFEKNKVGGTCLNEGCIPLKAFLHISKLYREATQVGIKTATPPNIDAVGESQRSIQKLKRGLEYSLKRLNIEIVYEEVLKVEKTENYRVFTSNGEYQAKDLIVATGSTQLLPDIKGLDIAIKNGRAFTSREFLESNTIPMSVAIIGAGVVGLEIASYYLDYGVDVTIIESKKTILNELDPDIRETFIRSFQERGATFLFDAQICEIEDCSENINLIYKTADEWDELEAELLIVATGRKPMDCFNNIDGAYVCGDANGKSMLAHTAMKEATIIAKQICGEEIFLDYDTIPHVIYSTPEVAWIGEECEDRDCVSKSFSMDYASRYVIESGDIRGLIKKKYKDGKIISCQIVGNGASELIATSMIDDANIVYPHPSISEINAFFEKE